MNYFEKNRARKGHTATKEAREARDARRALLATGGKDGIIRGAFGNFKDAERQALAIGTRGEV